MMPPSRAWSLRITLLLGAAVALSTGTAAAQCSGGASGPRNSPSPHGVSITYDARATPAGAWDLGQQAGFKWIRITAFWDLIEPQRGTFDWSSIQGAVDEAAWRGFSILIVLQAARTPQWARGPANRPECEGPNAKPEARPPADPAYFYEFARQAALELGNKVVAWEIWGEPNGCWSWRGSQSQYRQLVLAPGYDGVKSAGHPSIVLAPGLFNATNFDAWLTYEKNGSRYLTRPIDAFSIHLYESLSDGKSDLNTADNYIACMEDTSYCVLNFWLTEFSFGKHPDGCTNCALPSGNPTDPGGKGVQLIDHCLSHNSFCKKHFWWDLFVDHPCCEYWLIDEDLTPNAKYFAVKDYVLAHP